MKQSCYRFALLLLCSGLLPCVHGPGVLAAPAAPASVASIQGGELDGMDRSVIPGDDFFSFANGDWLTTHMIPADRASYGIDPQLAELNEQRIAQLIQQIAASGASADAQTRQIADYYDSFMDEAAIEARGLAPVRPALDRIAAIRDRSSLTGYLGGTLRADVDILNNTELATQRLLGLWVAQDLDDPSRYLPFLVQGGLGMPDRDYYLQESPKMAQVRERYQAYIAALLKLAGESDPDSKAAAIYALEHKIAQAHVSREQSEDVKSGDNHWTRSQFTERAPGMDWDAYFSAAGLGQQPEFVVWQPSAVIAIAALVNSESLETWKAYLTFHELSHSAPFLPKAFVDEHFAFYGTVLSGTPTNRERWKRAITYTNGALGDAVGRLYVQRYFPPEAKARIEDLVRHLIAAFAVRIDQLKWMGPETRSRAKAKLAALRVSVGYPDHWRDYSELEVRRDDALGNRQRAELFDYHFHLAKLGRPVDRSEWVMWPQEVNAVNLPAMNALNFPAGILQPPYFDPQQPAALNYGAIGAIIGHEISHSFDDQGAMFDASGRLHNWWTDADLAHFRASAQQLVRQYDAYRPFSDLSVNGQQTLSENIADVAGLAVAFSAYHLSLNGRTAASLKGFDGDQQFFIAFAQAWREKSRDPALRRQIIADGHAPAQYRAQTVRNIDAWYPAFNVRPGQKLYLPSAERVSMW
jgi:predicted metalloendopeptidase